MQKGGAVMRMFTVINDGNEAISYRLESYSIDKKNDYVIVRFNSLNFAIAYELRSDSRWPILDDIESYLKNLMEVIDSNNYTLKIVEDIVRLYVMIGYEADDKLEIQKFTASRLN